MANSKPMPVVTPDDGQWDLHIGLPDKAANYLDAPAYGSGRNWLLANRARVFNIVDSCYKALTDFHHKRDFGTGFGLFCRCHLPRGSYLLISTAVLTDLNLKSFEAGRQVMGPKTTTADGTFIDTAFNLSPAVSPRFSTESQRLGHATNSADPEVADIDVTGLGDAEASRMIAAGDVYKTPNAVYTSLIGEDRVTRLALLLTRDVLCNNQLIMECYLDDEV